MKFHRILILLAAVLSPLVMGNVQASEEAKAVINTMIQKEKERSAGIESYVVMEEYSIGAAQVLMYEKLPEKDGKYLGFRMVPPDEVQYRLNQKLGMSADQYRGACNLIGALGMAGLLGLASSVPISAEPLNEIGGDLFQSMVRSRQVIANSAGFVDTSDEEQTAADMQEFAEMAEVSVKTGANGREFYELLAENIGKTQVNDNGEFTINTVSLRITKDDYAPFSLKMTGESKTEESGTSPMEIQKSETNYREITGSSLYMPFTITMSIKSQFLPDNKKKEMEKAMKEMEEFEKQLENMSDEQKQMIEAMMGDKLKEQLEMVKNMMSEEAIGTTVNVKKICIGGIEMWLQMTAELHNVEVGEFDPGPQRCTSS